MAATREEINEWIAQAKREKQKFIISVCDTWDYDDYPVYCKDLNNVKERSIEFDDANMQRINEIIRINDDGTVNENLSLYELT